MRSVSLSNGNLSFDAARFVAAVRVERSHAAPVTLVYLDGVDVPADVDESPSDVLRAVQEALGGNAEKQYLAAQLQRSLF